MVWLRSRICHLAQRRRAFALPLPLGGLSILLLVACGSGAPLVKRANAVRQTPSHRVILISLDGAGTDTLHDLYRQGLLREGGFERFFREGQVADALIPVDPTLTSANHISLVTGFPPSATGIVGNQFLVSGSPTESASGFAAPIGTETLWEAARRQGRQVGVLTWPGADAKGERRTADWGLVFNGTADRAPQIVTLSRADWQPPPPGSGPNATAGGPAPPVARVRIGDETSGAVLALHLSAVNGRGDGYDGVAVTGEPADGGGGDVGGTGGGGTVGATAILHAGEWRQVSWPQPGGPAASWVKLVALTPDLASARLYLGPVYHTIAYPSGFAERLIRHGLYWPGPPDSGSLVAGWQGRPGIDLDTWTEQAGHLAAYVGGALRLAAAGSDWDLLLGYIPVIDDAGHRLLLLDPRQPDFSAERRDDLARAHVRVWQAVDRELRELLAGLDLTRTTVVVVSDHGMAPVHTAIDPNAPLADLGLLAKKDAVGGSTPAPSAQAIPDSGVAQVYLNTGSDAGVRARTLAALIRRYADWRIAGEAPIERVFSRQEAARVGLNHPNSGDLILFAREGYAFRNLPEGKASAPAPIYGAHGYLGTHRDMRAIYLAVGAGVKPGTRGMVQATTVAPRVAGWLGMAPPAREIRTTKSAGGMR